MGGCLSSSVDDDHSPRTTHRTSSLSSPSKTYSTMNNLEYGNAANNNELLFNNSDVVGNGIVILSSSGHSVADDREDKKCRRNSSSSSSSSQSNNDSRRNPALEFPHHHQIVTSVRKQGSRSSSSIRQKSRTSKSSSINSHPNNSADDEADNDASRRRGNSNPDDSSSSRGSDVAADSELTQELRDLYLRQLEHNNNNNNIQNTDEVQHDIVGDAEDDQSSVGIDKDFNSANDIVFGASVDDDRTFDANGLLDSENDNSLLNGPNTSHNNKNNKLQSRAASKNGINGNKNSPSTSSANKSKSTDPKKVMERREKENALSPEQLVKYFKKKQDEALFAAAAAAETTAEMKSRHTNEFTSKNSLFATTTKANTSSGSRSEIGSKICDSSVNSPMLPRHSTLSSLQNDFNTAAAAAACVGASPPLTTTTSSSSRPVVRNGRTEQLRFNNNNNNNDVVAIVDDDKDIASMRSNAASGSGIEVRILAKKRYDQKHYHHQRDHRRPTAMPADDFIAISTNGRVSSSISTRQQQPEDSGTLYPNFRRFSAAPGETRCHSHSNNNIRLRGRVQTTLMSDGSDKNFTCDEDPVGSNENNTVDSSLHTNNDSSTAGVSLSRIHNHLESTQIGLQSSPHLPLLRQSPGFRSWESSNDADAHHHQNHHDHDENQQNLLLGRAVTIIASNIDRNHLHKQETQTSQEHSSDSNQQLIEGNTDDKEEDEKQKKDNSSCDNDNVEGNNNNDINNNNNHLPHQIVDNNVDHADEKSNDKTISTNTNGKVTDQNNNEENSKNTKVIGDGDGQNKKTCIIISITANSDYQQEDTSRSSGMSSQKLDSRLSHHQPQPTVSSSADLPPKIGCNNATANECLVGNTSNNNHDLVRHSNNSTNNANNHSSSLYSGLMIPKTSGMMMNMTTTTTTVDDDDESEGQQKSFQQSSASTGLTVSNHTTQSPMSPPKPLMTQQMSMMTQNHKK